MQTKEIQVNGVQLFVQYNVEEMYEVINSIKTSFEGQYTKMYTVDKKVTKEEFESDIEEAEAFIRKLKSGQVDLTEPVEKVRKKKNQKFWSNSGHDVLTLSNISDYFTDFTNAWSVLVFRLEVVSETVCQLRLRNRTYTY